MGSTLLAAPEPSTPLGPFEDSAVAWATWVTLMGCLGLVVLTLVVSGPVARRLGSDTLASTTTRAARVAVVFGALSVPAVLSDVAHDLSETGGYRYGAAWDALFDGTNEGRLLGIEVSGMIAAVVLLAPLTLRRVAVGRARGRLLSGALAVSAIALGTTKFPAEKPDQWGRTVFDTGMWMLHLFGGAVWVGGLIGLVVLAMPGAIDVADRVAFWPPAIRRFSVAAMSCVATIALSGIWLYWTHVDGPTQLVKTMYGRILGVKILIFGSLLLLGAVNQFWLHPRIEALRAAGDSRPLRVVLARDFPAVVAVEVMLGLGVLMVAPFLHGSARNQAFQTGVAHRSSVVIPVEELPKIADKPVSTSTWVWGSLETVAVTGVMAAGLTVSGRLARRKITSAMADPAPGNHGPDGDELVDALTDRSR